MEKDGGQGQRVCVVGRSGSGKTVFMRQFMKYNNFDVIIVMASSVKEGEYYNIPCKEKYFYSSFNPDVIVDTMIEIENTPKANRRNYLFIFDDMMSQIGSDSQHKKLLNKFATEIRKYKVSLIVVQQAIKGLSNMSRSQIDHIIVTRIHPIEIKNLIEYVTYPNVRSLTSQLKNYKLGKAFYFNDNYLYGTHMEVNYDNI